MAVNRTAIVDARFTEAQVMIALGWLGLRARTDFLGAQKSDAPPVLSMVRAAVVQP